MGGIDKVIEKIESYAHQEYNIPEIKDRQRLESIIRAGGDIFNRNIPFKYSIIDKTYPEYVVNNFFELKNKGLIL